MSGELLDRVTAVDTTSSTQNALSYIYEYASTKERLEAIRELRYALAEIEMAVIEEAPGRRAVEETQEQ